MQTANRDVYDDLVPTVHGLNLSATFVRADNSMMSFIFSRGLTWPPTWRVGFKHGLPNRVAAALPIADAYVRKEGDETE